MKTTANTTIKPDLQATLRQMTIGKNANAVGWGHCDYVYLWTGSERINLTRMPKDERNKLLKQFNISE